jgi:hypothetical protein
MPDEERISPDAYGCVTGLEISNIPGDTHLLSELPPMHGENRGKGASYGA